LLGPALSALNNAKTVEQIEEARKRCMKVIEGAAVKAWKAEGGDSVKEKLAASKQAE